MLQVIICLRLYLSCSLTQTCLLSLPHNQPAVQSRPQGPFYSALALVALSRRGSRGEEDLGNGVACDHAL